MIEKLARQLTPATQIGCLLGIDEDVFSLDIQTKGNPARIAFLRGMSVTANDLRCKNLELAEACAPSAITQCFSDLNKMLIDLQ